MEKVRQDVHDREQQHPNDVNEVPIQRHAGHERMPVRSELARRRQECRNAQKDDSDGHVQTVETGQREEVRRVRPTRVEPDVLMKEVRPFITLNAHEDRAQQRREREPTGAFLTTACSPRKSV